MSDDPRAAKPASEHTAGVNAAHAAALNLEDDWERTNRGLIAQHETGWVSKDTVEFVASYLDMPSIAVWEVATFYNMYNLEKPGQYKITICTNLPCALRGAEEAAEHLKKKLQIDFNQTSADGRFTLKEGECMGACVDAPVCLVNDRQMEPKMTPANLDKMLDELKNR